MAIDACSRVRPRAESAAWALACARWTDAKRSHARGPPWPWQRCLGLLSGEDLGCLGLRPDVQARNVRVGRALWALGCGGRALMGEETWCDSPDGYASVDVRHEADGGILKLGFQRTHRHVQELPMDSAQALGHVGLKRPMQQQVLVLCCQGEHKEGISECAYLIYLSFHTRSYKRWCPKWCAARSHPGRSQCPVLAQQRFHSCHMSGTCAAKSGGRGR
jgi:hypothetical protein